MTEECLLSVMALNLKRMVKASFFLLSPPLMCHVSRDLLWNDYFVNRSLIVHYQPGRYRRKWKRCKIKWQDVRVCGKVVKKGTTRSNSLWMVKNNSIHQVSAIQ